MTWVGFSYMIFWINFVLIRKHIYFQTNKNWIKMVFLIFQASKCHNSSTRSCKMNLRLMFRLVTIFNCFHFIISCYSHLFLKIVTLCLFYIFPSTSYFHAVLINLSATAKLILSDYLSIYYKEKNMPQNEIYLNSGLSLYTEIIYLVYYTDFIINFSFSDLFLISILLDSVFIILCLVEPFIKSRKHFRLNVEKYFVLDNLQSTSIVHFTCHNCSTTISTYF
ncbi:hypothetical protein ACJX0J_007166 [Zea mays]